MKFKFPKKITIGDGEFYVKYDPKRSDAEFQYPYNKKKGFLIIGTENIKLNPVRVLAMIIHELKEIIQVEQCTRFESRDAANSYQFHYTHKEHSDLCSRLACLLDNFIK